MTQGCFEAVKREDRMALKKCKECGTAVSSTAEACPKCGAVLKKKTSFAVGCLAVIFCFGGIGALMQAIPEWFPSASSSSSPTPTSQPSQAVENLEVLNANWVRGDFGTRSIKGTVRNNTGKQYKYVQVEINLYDGAGAQVGSTLANVNNLEPNSVWHFEAPVIEDSARTFRVKAVSKF